MSTPPEKTKKIRGNNKPYVSNEMRKEIMLRSRLKRKANKSQLPEDILQYKSQRNRVVTLNRKNKKYFFSRLHIKCDQKNFWEACKPILSSRPSKKLSKIHLEKNGIVIADDLEISQILNKKFVNVVSELNLCAWNPEIIMK